MSGDKVLDAGWEVLTESLPTFREFAGTVTVSDGSHKGAGYSPDIHPAQACIADAVEAGASWVAIAKPVQDGGSLIAFVLMLWRVVSRGQTAILAYPTLTAARDAWVKKLQPMLSAIGKLPKKGGGSGGGAASVVNIPGGGSVIIRSAGGRGESGQASATGDVLIPDEVDDWPDLRRVKLIEQRISKSPDPLQVYISTVKRDGEGKEGSHILRLWEAGSQTTLEYPCPHCGAQQPLIWERMDLASARIACAGCGVLLTEHERLTMLPNWRRVDGRKSDQFSIRWTALDSPFPIVVNGKRRPVMQGLVDEFRAAEAHAAISDHAYMRQFYRDRLCRPYTGDGDGEVPALVDMQQAARATRSPHERGEIPDACSIVTVGCDAGKRDCWHLTLGMRPDRAWYVVDWGHRYTGDPKAEPTPNDQISMFDALRARICRIGRADAMGIDVGYNTDLVERWASDNGFMSMRGDARPNGKREDHSNRRVPSWAEARRQDNGTVWWFIDGAVVKSEIAKALARDPGSEGAGHLPRGQAAGDWLIRHLTAEAWDAKLSAWVKRRPDNHLLDCLVYAYALAVITLMQREAGGDDLIIIGGMQ